MIFIIYIHLQINNPINTDLRLIIWVYFLHKKRIPKTRANWYHNLVSKVKGGFTMIYGYIRVSSKSQQDNNSFEQQERAIKERWEDAEIFREQFTGTTTHRPILDDVISRLKPNDTLVVTKLDRLARTTVEGIELVQSERTQSGKMIAKMNPNYVEGRPKKYGKEQIAHALELLEDNSHKEVERLTGISKSTLIRAKK